MARDLTEVIDAMLAHVPERSVNFRRVLEEAKTTDEYLSPPELEHEHWTHTAKTLASYIPANPAQRQEWQNEVMRIWNAAT